MLTTTDWEQIKALQEEVERADGISLKLNWNMLQDRSPGEQSDFIFRKNGQIVAFLALYDFASKVEVCGMVAPDFRRQGIFTSLLKEALPKDRAGAYSEILLNTPGASDSGLAFVKSVGATPGVTEYQMKYNPLKEEDKPLNEAVTLRPAVESDKRHLILLDIQGFDESEEEARQMNETLLREQNSITYLIECGDEPAGKLRVSTEDKESWIYGFAVYTHLRGQGVGRSALAQTVKREHGEGRDVFLEVALENKRALQLYESCGFELIHVQDYFNYRP